MRQSLLAATAILAIFIVSVGANVVNVNAGRSHSLQTVGPPPGGCVGEGSVSVQEWCPGQEGKTWKRGLVCHNGQLVQQTQDCSTGPKEPTPTAQCSAGDPPKDVTYCKNNPGQVATEKLCILGEWKQADTSSDCPSCSPDEVDVILGCPASSDSSDWRIADVCVNGKLERVTRDCDTQECQSGGPQQSPSGGGSCAQEGHNVWGDEVCCKKWTCNSAGRWELQETDECCYIATATYGSELSPEVQLLRNFRDRDVLQTFAGSNFMRVFNMVYYSFSFRVAGTISTNDNLRTMMRYVLYPLIGILWATQQIYSAFAFGPEGAVVIAGVFAGSLIGLVYASPVILVVSFAIARVFRRRPTRVHVYLSLPFLAIATSLIIVSELTRFEMLMQVSTGLLMLTTWALPGIALSAWALNRHR
jgi:hypothetical protein